MEVGARIIVSGLVQGVFYRAFTKEKAVALELAGWVRNLPDGRVEVFVQGPKEKILELAEELRQGPPTAQVADFELSWRPPVANLTGFKIRY